MSNYSSCWANYRGDCNRGMSNEHLISKALFPDQVVYISGIDWCKGQEKCVGINSLTRKILCAHHNNSLSKADKTAVNAIQAFHSGIGINEIDGILLERWLIKTAINLTIGSSLHIGVGMKDSNYGRPSPYLLAVAFGELPLAHKMGAYFLFPNGPYAHRQEEISLIPLQQGNSIGGFLFGLRGQYVFLNLYAGHAPINLNEISENTLPKHIACASLIYRPRNIKVSMGEDPTRCIKMKWD